MALRVLDEHVETARAYINAIRNKNGNITVPQAKEKDEAVNLQLLHDRVTIAINKVKDELSEIIKKEETERKEADETFIKTAVLYEAVEESGLGINFRNNNGYIKLESEILLLGAKGIQAETTLPIYHDINARVDELKNKSGITTDTVRSEAENIVIGKLQEIFKNGYIQSPDMKTPDKALNFVKPAQQVINKPYWEEIGSFEEYYRKKDGSSSTSKFTIWQLKIQEHSYFPGIPGLNPDKHPEPSPNPGDSFDPKPPKPKF